MDSTVNTPAADTASAATAVDEPPAIPLSDGVDDKALSSPHEHRVAERVLEPSRSLVALDLAAVILALKVVRQVDHEARVAPGGPFCHRPCIKHDDALLGSQL